MDKFLSHFGLVWRILHAFVLFSRYFYQFDGIFFHFRINEFSEWPSECEFKPTRSLRFESNTPNTGHTIEKVKKTWITWMLLLRSKTSQCNLFCLELMANDATVLTKSSTGHSRKMVSSTKLIRITSNMSERKCVKPSWNKFRPRTETKNDFLYAEFSELISFFSKSICN